MDLIIPRPLEPGEAEAIQELTMKKRQSKKTKMSQNQLLARHQLAQELRGQRLLDLYEELDKYLTEYESLIAQEKALLGAHNIDLFDTQSVNNFHLHDQINNNNHNSSSSRLIITSSNSLDSGLSRKKASGLSRSVNSLNLKLSSWSEIIKSFYQIISYYDSKIILANQQWFL